VIVIVSRRAAREIKESTAWYEKQDRGLGGFFQEKLEDAISRISVFPVGFPEIRPKVRKCLIKTFPYAVLYDAESTLGTVYVLSVYHQFRDPDTYLN
jgi:plasmid stabilization system protein ParE